MFSYEASKRQNYIQGIINIPEMRQDIVIINKNEQ
jgi:hypothetical protein